MNKSKDSEVSGIVKRKYGAKVLNYLNNKNRGGQSGQKGVRYEDNFATYLIVKLFSEFFQCDTDHWPGISDQVFGFVDDLRIEEKKKITFYQCKNSPSVSWDSNDKKIQLDFERQYAVSSEIECKSIQTVLVVSSEVNKNTLINKIPLHIKHYSHVLFFPYCDANHSRLVQEFDDLRDVLTFFCRKKNPSFDEFLQVFGVLQLAYMQKGASGSLWDIYLAAQKFHPSVIALTPKQVEGFSYLDGFERQLANVGDLTYNLTGGHFCWEWLDMNGVYPYDCLSNEFLSFQQQVIDQKPKDFDELEGLLSCLKGSFRSSLNNLKKFKVS